MCSFLSRVQIVQKQRKVMSLLIIVVSLSLLAELIVSATNVPIGGIFDDPYQDNEIAFRVAIDKANSYDLTQHVLTPLIANIEPEDVADQYQTVVGITWKRPFAAIETTCSVLNSGVVAIISPLLEHNSNAVQSVCDAKEVPFIRTTPVDEDTHDCCTMNLFPSPPMLARAFADLVEQSNWNTFTVMYESQLSFSNIEEILKLYKAKNPLVVEHLQRSDSGDYRDVLKMIRKSGQKNFVLHCETDNLDEILQQAQQVGLMMKKYSYIIISLELHTIDLKPYQNSEANITSMQIVDPTNLAVIEVAKAMQNKRKEWGLNIKTDDSRASAWRIETSTALIVDAVMLLAETLRDAGHFKAKSLFCNATDNWEHGSTIFNFMKMKTFSGLTGLIQFDHYGIRRDFTLNVVKLTEDGIIKIGHWNIKEGLNISHQYQSFLDVQPDPHGLRNTTIKVMICWSEPYALYKNDSAVLIGNDQYEGFVIDLIKEIAELEKFNYILLRNPDDKNGDYNLSTNTWNGMIGDILDETGDIAIGDLTITRQREQFVDFTTPFMSSGIQILYKKSLKPTPEFFAFAGPFSPQLWLFISISYFIVSIGMYIMARICPAEWGNWDPCVQQPKYLINRYNMRNSLWYNLGCLLQAGPVDLPTGISTRVLSSVWAFFILVIVSYYKAELIASLLIENYQPPFKDMYELANKSEELGIRYGAVANEAIHNFFKTSENELHQKVAAYMDAHPQNMVYDNWEGFLLIDAGNYAYFTESVYAQFVTNVVCYLQTVGDPINEQNFAIAMRKGAPYRGVLSEAILTLLENGKIGELQKKWWEEKFKVEECGDSQVDPVATPMNLEHVAGIFWITIGGVVAAYLFVFLELAVHIWKKYGRNRQAFMEEFKAELKFYFTFKSMVKPMKGGKIATLSENNTDTLEQTTTN